MFKLCTRKIGNDKLNQRKNRCGEGMEEIIKDTLSKLQEIHKKAQKLAEADSVPGALKNEFSIKTNQYETMFNDLEQMKALTDKPETIENLLNQEINVLKTRIKWELEIVKKMMTYC